MNMYEKREQRKNKKLDTEYEQNEVSTSCNIHWGIGTYRQQSLNPYKY